MKQCWPEGDLRAYLDGEVPPGVRERIGDHLQACAECSARYTELSGRAARVANLMAALPEVAPAGAFGIVPLPARHRRQWAVAALSLAAALAVGFVMLPKSGRQVAPIAKAPAVAAPAPAKQPAAVATRAHAVRRRAAQQGTAQQADYFLRLDDEPLETGTIVRIGAENGDVQADLILGPDGRAHAIRVVSNQ
jgi:anti-sigma factor RsiW